MSRMLKARNFTCQACRTPMPRERMAMTTSQAAICRDCYSRGWRIRIRWLGGHSYITQPVRAESMEDPDRPGGVRNLVLEDRGPSPDRPEGQKP